MSDGGRKRLLDRLVEANCSIKASPPQRKDIVYLCALLVRCTLPHRAQAETQFERRDGDYAITFMSPGSVGLPFGMWPRLFLKFLSTEVVLTGQREIVLGSSMSAFVRSLGVSPTGGPNGSLHGFRSQLLRTLALMATLTRFGDGQATLQNCPVADRFEILWTGLGTERDGVTPSKVVIGERMFQEMLSSPVPLDRRALRAVQQSPLATDIYAWTTYRAYRLPASHPTCIPWASLRIQFAAGYGSESDFKAAFRSALRQVQMVYPTLRCEATPAHFVMWRSPPSVPATAPRRVRGG